MKIEVDFTPATTQAQPKAAYHALAEFLVKISGEDPPPDKVAIYGFTRHGDTRISEISFVRGNGGASWMRSDLDAAAIIFAAEEFVLWYGEPIESHGGDNYMDIAQEAERGLQYAVTGDMGEWEDRR